MNNHHHHEDKLALVTLVLDKLFPKELIKIIQDYILEMCLVLVGGQKVEGTRRSHRRLCTDTIKIGYLEQCNSVFKLNHWEFRTLKLARRAPYLFHCKHITNSELIIYSGNTYCGNWGEFWDKTAVEPLFYKQIECSCLSLPVGTNTWCYVTKTSHLVATLNEGDQKIDGFIQMDEQKKFSFEIIFPLNEEILFLNIGFLCFNQTYVICGYNGDHSCHIWMVDQQGVVRFHSCCPWLHHRANSPQSRMICYQNEYSDLYLFNHGGYAIFKKTGIENKWIIKAYPIELHPITCYSRYISGCIFPWIPNTLCLLSESCLCLVTIKEEQEVFNLIENGILEIPRLEVSIETIECSD